MSSSSTPPADEKPREPSSRDGRIARVKTKTLSPEELERAVAARELRDRKTPDLRVEGDYAAPVERIRLTGAFGEERTGTRSTTVPPDEEG